MRKRRLHKGRLAMVICIAMAMFFIIVAGIKPLVSNALEELNTPFIEHFEEVPVRVRSGETAWQLQRELAPSYDIREVLHHVNIINGKSVSNIRAGEVIILLKEKASE